MEIKKHIRKIGSIPKKSAVFLIGVYSKFISPFFPPSCRYVPTCSQYATIAIQRFGFLKGTWLALKRIVKCNPWHKCGYDPVPDKKS